MKLVTTEQVYKMAGTESEQLSHIKSRKLRYFRHCDKNNTRQHWSQRDDRPCGRSEKLWKTKDCCIDITAWTGITRDRGRWSQQI